MIVPQYMGHLDRGEIDEAMQLVEPDVQFNLFLPGRTISGTYREELLGYVSGRPAVVRLHNIIRTAATADYESVYGVVTDDGNETGAFQASAKLSERGKLQRYLVYFDVDVRLFELG